jgi:ribulose-5-phosphate 4-epimerase/fuculose-1-phosphate aldolase
MAEQEGVIKYQLQHDDCALPAAIDIRQLNAWRSLLYKLDLIGQSADKYGGLGYGNISQRLTIGLPAFLITGTQTGHLASLESGHFAVVDSAEPLLNQLQSRGPSLPSSEALTHASVYCHQPSANAVIHVHCPQLWHNTQSLQLPSIGSEIAYGTVAMAHAVETLLKSGQLDKLSLFCMLGHKDGVVCFGKDLDEAANILLTQLSRAIAIEQTANSR